MPTPTLDALMNEKHSLAPRILRQLSQDDQRRLREAALDPASRVSRLRAFRWLFHAAPDSAAEVFRRVIRDPAESETVKAACADFAVQLGEGDDDLVEEVIRLAESAGRPALRARLAGILGRAGGQTAHEALQLLAADESARVQRAARRAMDLLGQRFGEPAEAPAAFEEEPGRPSTRLEVDMAPRSEAAEVLDHVRGFVWGVRLSADYAARWTCQGRTMMALRNKSFRPTLGKGGIAALIAGIEPGEGLWEVDWIIVARRRRDGSIAVLSRPADGDPVWAGNAARPEDPVTLRTLEGRYPLIRATVSLGPDRIPVERIDRWDAPLHKKRSPRPDIA